MSEVIDAAVKKLTDEKDHITENPNTARLIAEYLTEQCKKDESFAAKVNQGHKTLEKCNSYITQKAKDYLKSKDGGIEDKIVYGWADDYYNLDDAAIEAEKKRKQEEADKRAAEVRAQAEERRKKAKAEKKKTDAEKKVEKAAEKEAKKQDAGQISFF
jgi:predicted ABC-class ATPase